MHPGGEDLRDADLKKVVLDELLAQHGDAQLDAQLHQAACMSALDKKTETFQTNSRQKQYFTLNH